MIENTLSWRFKQCNKREEIYQLTVDIQNSGWKEFIEILDYLQQKKLIEFVYDDGLKPYFKNAPIKV